MAELSVIATLKGVDQASPAIGKATASLQNFVKTAQGASASTQSSTGAMSKAFSGLGSAVTAPLGAIGKLAGAVASGIGMAAGFQAFNSLGAAIGAAGQAAVGFEQRMSAIGAVAGATGGELKGLSTLALQLGKETAFSASQAAGGIEELVKGGVSIADIMGGAASAALNLAAAGGTSVAEAATIASNAMNQFGLSGEKAAHVSDLVAGAANASSISVSDFNQSLASGGVVAAASGQSIDAFATAVALMGAQGIKGSDAGTSLKAMFNTLIPTTKEATAKMRDLGIITANGSNQFIDATGRIKDYGQIAEILQRTTGRLTESQRSLALETIFGTDGMRAALVATKNGAAGYDTMRASMLAAGGAAAIARERLNNTAGDIEQLKGSLETLAIVVLGQVAPAFRPAIQAATEFTNRFTQEAQTLIQTAENIASAHGLGMIPATLTAIELRIGEVFGPAAQERFHGFRAAIEDMAKGWNGLAASTDHNSLVIRDAMVRLDTSGLAQATDHNAVIFRNAWNDMAGSTTHNSQVIQQWMDTVGGPAWAGLTESHDRHAAEYRKTWENMAEAARTNVRAILDALQPLKAAWDVLQAFADRNAPAFRKAWDDMAAATEHNSHVIRGETETTAFAVTDMVASIADGLGTIPPAAEDAADGMGQAMDALPEAVQAQISPVAAATDAVGASLDTLATGATTAVADANDVLSTLPAAVESQASPVAGAVETINGSLDTLSAGATEAVAGAGEAMNTLPAVVEGQTPGVAGGVDSIGAALNVLGAKAQEAVTAAGAALGGVVAAVSTQAGPAGSAALAVGANIINGIVNGITSGIPRVLAAAGNMAQTAINAAMGRLKEGSPSQVFEEIGENVDQGFVDGVDAGSDDLIGAIETMLSEATATAAAGTVDVADAFGALGDLLGAQYERTRSIVEQAQDKIEADRVASVRRMHRDEQIEETKHGRQMADLQERLADAQRAAYKTPQARLDAVTRANDAIEKAQEAHGQRMADIVAADGDRQVEITIDGVDAVLAAQERQNLERGKGLRDFQRGLEDLERDAADHANAIHQKAEDARTAAFRTTAEGIEEANRRVEDSIRELNERRDEAFSLRGRQDVFSTGQDAASRVFSQGREDADLIVRQTEQVAERRQQLEQSAADLSRQRSREDADAEYELRRDLAEAVTDEDKARIQERYDRYRQDLARRRGLDDDERAVRAKEDEAALQASFKKAQADLAKRRQAEQEERDFRKRQETERRNFEDGLAQEALDKQVAKLETERDERIRTINEALEQKLKDITKNEGDEREALRRSHEQKLQDLKERFLDRVGPLTGEALSAFETLFDGIKKRIEDSTAAVTSLADAMGRAAMAKLPAAGGGGATWASQSQAVRDMFTATWGAQAQTQWEREHAAETQQQQGSPAPGTNAQGRVSGDTSGLQEGSAAWWAEENFRRNTSGRAAGGSVLAGVAYPVGERGPETFIPWTDGMIAPTGATLGGWRGGGGGDTTINVILPNATILGGDKQRIAEELADAFHTALLRKQQRNGSLGLH